MKAETNCLCDECRYSHDLVIEFNGIRSGTVYVCLECLKKAFAIVDGYDPTKES